MKKYLALFIAVLFVISSVACGNTGEQNNSETQTESAKPVDYTVDDNEYFVKDGKSEYKILLAETADVTVRSAAEALRDKVEEATGAKLEMIVGNVIAGNGKYISLGETSIYGKDKVSYSYDELGREGYKIKTVGDDVYLVGTTSDAIRYAVCGFLRRYFDYRYYYEDVYRLTKKSTANLLTFDVTDVPDIGTRACGTKTLDFNTELRNELRLHTLYDGWGPLSAHTYFKIVNPDIYKDEHREWYSTDGKNLCLSHVDRDVFTENLKKIILENPGMRYAMIGQEDTFTFCSCNQCKERIQYWKNKGATNDTATVAIATEFSNDIARRLDEWIQAEHPERKDLKLYMFSYNATKFGPCKETASGVELLDSSLKLRDNLGVMLVPYNAAMNYGFGDSENSLVKKQFDMWKKATDNIFVWMYDLNFDEQIQAFISSFGALAKDFKFMKEYGVKWLIVERSSQKNNQGMNFEHMKNFVSAELMWDVDADVEDLIDEFMVAYYKEAAPAMKEYLDLMTIKFAEFAADDDNLYTSGVRFTDSSKWSSGFLQETCLGLFDKAYKAIEIYEDKDYEMYTELKNRITLETFYVRYLLVTLYPYEFVDAETERENLANEMRAFGIETTI